MNGPIALLGSAGYFNETHALDRQLLAKTQCSRPRVVCVPAASKRNLSEFTQIMNERFHSLCASVAIAPIGDRVAAHDRRWGDLLRSADLIYLYGVQPLYLRQTLKDTPAWTAIVECWQHGGLIASSSAADALMLAAVDVTRSRFRIVAAFGLVPKVCIWPHFNRSITKQGLTVLTDHLTAHGMCAVGINDNTALVGRLGEPWQVIGMGSVSLITPDTSMTYPSGQHLTLPLADSRYARTLS